MNLPSSNDTELTNCALAGQRDAFAQIVARYQSLVCSLAYSATGSLSLSEDIAQETFIAAWKGLRTLREPEKLRPWLCGIARNVIAGSVRFGSSDCHGRGIRQGIRICQDRVCRRFPRHDFDSASWMPRRSSHITGDRQKRRLRARESSVAKGGHTLSRYLCGRERPFFWDPRRAPIFCDFFFYGCRMPDHRDTGQAPSKGSRTESRSKRGGLRARIRRQQMDCLWNIDGFDFRPSVCLPDRHSRDGA
jgi:DNA-directed RNA polymerase specialized sigma24 family protein